MHRTALITHSDCLNHINPAGHPESPQRLRVVLDALSGAGFENLLRLEAPLASMEAIERVHPASEVTHLIAQAPEQSGVCVRLDADTYLSTGSIGAARRAAGAVVAAVDGVLSGQFDRAFCATRPPGHHAEVHTPMGFCLWNSAAIGAYHAKAAFGLKRVAIVDFDVHHGNGSQELACRDPYLFYGSVHQGGIYPGSGLAHETAFGNLVNCPVPDQSGGAVWRASLEEVLLPSLHAFRPELILVSAGFDGHRLDPLAGLNLEIEDFVWITEQLLEISNGKLVSTLEGGYHLQALAESARAHVLTLLSYDARYGGETAGV